MDYSKRHSRYTYSAGANRKRSIWLFPLSSTSFFDNRGNLISLTSYDIDEGYCVYVFVYDEDERIVFQEERIFSTYYQPGDGVDFSSLSRTWDYLSEEFYTVSLCYRKKNYTEELYQTMLIEYYDYNNCLIKSERYNMDDEDNSIDRPAA